MFAIRALRTNRAPSLAIRSFAHDNGASRPLDPKFAQAKLDRLNRIERAAEMFAEGVLPGEIAQKIDLAKPLAISTIRGYLIHKARESPEFKEILSSNMDRAFHEDGFLQGQTEFDEVNQILQRLDDRSAYEKSKGYNAFKK